MFLLGTIVNSVLIIIGSIIGRFLNRIPEKMKETVMYGIALDCYGLRITDGINNRRIS